MGEADDDTQDFAPGANPGAAVLNSGFHDASATPEHNADLAKRRVELKLQWRHIRQAGRVMPCLF